MTRRPRKNHSLAFKAKVVLDALKGEETIGSRGVKKELGSRGRRMDNMFIERLWKTVKHEEIHLKAYNSIADVSKGLKTYFERYKLRRHHQGLGDRAPDEVCLTTMPEVKEAV